MLITCLFGFFGNVAAIVTFAKPRSFQKNFYIFMLSLAISDIVYIFVSVLLFLLPQLSSFYKYNGPWHYIVPWAIPLGQVSLTGSVYFTMVITIERYLTVCHPYYMLQRNWSTAPIVILVIFFAFLYNIPKFFEFYTTSHLCLFYRTISNDVCTLAFKPHLCKSKLPSENFGSSMYATLCTKQQMEDNINDTNSNPSEDQIVSIYTYSAPATKMRLNGLYVQLYATNLTFFVNGIIPFTVIILLNILILKAVRNIQNYYSSSNSKKGNHTHLRH